MSEILSWLETAAWWIIGPIAVLGVVYALLRLPQKGLILFLVGVLLWIPIMWSGTENTWFTVLAGLSIVLWTLFLIAFFFGLFSPLFIDLIVNNPRAKPGKQRPPIEPGRVYFFTFMEYGQTKIINRGDKFIRPLMEDPERIFVKGERDPHPYNADHWWIRLAESREKSEAVAPFNPLSPLSWWIHWVYGRTGAVWVGVPFFQELRIRKVRRVQEKKDGDKVVLDEKKGLPVLEEVEDWSDHLRTKSFLWPFKIPSVDTKDYMKIGYQGYLKCRVTNPYLAAYNIDRWDLFLTKALNTWTNNFNRARTYEELVASSDQTKNELASFLYKQLNGVVNPEERSGKIGLEILEASITDQEPQLEGEDQAALTAAWRAERQAKATVIAAGAEKTRRIKVSEGDAKALINRIRAARTHQELALTLAEYDAWKEVKGQALFNFGGRSTGNSALDAAILQKLTEMNDQLKKGGKS